jgi:Conjugative transposon protein TcpC
MAMSSRASVTVTPRPLWKIRLTQRFPRYILYALAIWGLLANARYAISPPRPVIPPAPHVEPPDPAAEGFASLFTRRYLTWNAAAPEAYQQALTPFLGSSAQASGGTQLPNTGEQKVQWTEVVQQRTIEPGEHIYTVAAQTDTAGLLYLTVGVIRKVNGGLALTGYPAFIGAPNSTTMDNRVERLGEVKDASLTTVITRALRNYLDSSSSDLAADLTVNAQVSLPGLPLTLQSVQQLRWLAGGGAVFAVVQASDQRGAQYTLDYELDVTQVQGRWEISAVQMNPDT